MWLTLRGAYKGLFYYCKYSKIPIISPGLTFQKAFLLGLFLGQLIFRGAYYWKEFCVSKWVGLDNQNSLKQLKQLALKVQWAYIWEGLLSEGCLRLRFGGLIFGRAYFFLAVGGGGGGIFGILRYAKLIDSKSS